MNFITAIMLGTGIMGCFYLIILYAFPTFSIAYIPVFLMVLMSMISKSLYTLNGNGIQKANGFFITALVFWIALVCYTIFVNLVMIFVLQFDHLLFRITLLSSFVLGLGFLLEKFLTIVIIKTTLASMGNKKLPLIIFLSFIGCVFILHTFIGHQYFTDILTKN